MDTADRLTVIDAVVVRPAHSADLHAIVGLFADAELHVLLDPTFAVLNGGHRRASDALARGPSHLVCVAAATRRHEPASALSRVSMHGD